ncbi:MAG TPA: chaperonin GroEL [Myxococcales bacterium]|nr:chaperonin GroEL [Myxococcales bacterium]
MTFKHLLFRSEARERVLRGAAVLADAVRVTLGPRAKCVLMERKWGEPLVCNDGVTIAKEVELKDPEENLGARMMREAAERTGELVGDGTTTSTLLAHAMLADGVRNVVAGSSAIELKRGLDRGLRAAIEAIRSLSRPVESRRQKEHVATISAHNDPSIGGVVADAFEKIGAEGVITVEEAKGTEVKVEIVDGMQFDRGFLSPYFITDPERTECVLRDARVLVTDRKLSAMDPLLPMLEGISQEATPLLVIAEDVEGPALATLVVNKLRGTLRCAAVKAPGFGDRRRAMLEDIAVLTGAQLISEDVGFKLENVRLEHLGRAAKVVVDRDKTLLAGGVGDKALLAARIEQIRKEIKETTSTYDKEKLQERLARLVGGVAVIQVGAPSEAEMRNRKEAFEDAISATRAAMAEGIVPGGGLALLRAIPAVEREEEHAEGDERIGLRILRHALEAPVRQIAENSGTDSGVVVERMRAGKDNTGFDAARGIYVDLVEAGIVDATKVVRVALENAVSVAGIVLLTEATLTEVPEEKRASHEPAMQAE